MFRVEFTQMSTRSLTINGTTGFIDGPKLAKMPQWQIVDILVMAAFGEIDIAFSLEQMASELGVPYEKVEKAILARRGRGAAFRAAA
jgi:hypothetical protein